MEFVRVMGLVSAKLADDTGRFAKVVHDVEAGTADVVLRASRTLPAADQGFPGSRSSTHARRLDSESGRTVLSGRAATTPGAESPSPHNRGDTSNVVGGAGGGRMARFIVTGSDGASVALDREPDLMSLARTHADEVIRQSEELGLRPQSVSSAVYNRHTGEVSYGENNTHYVGDPPDTKIRMGAPKPLCRELELRNPVESLEEWPVANCAETAGVNKGILDAELPESLSIHRMDRPPAVSDFAYSTVRTMTGVAYPSCRNCQVLLAGAVEVLQPGPQRGLFLGAGAIDGSKVFHPDIGPISGDP